MGHIAQKKNKCKRYDRLWFYWQFLQQMNIRMEKQNTVRKSV